jgi:hypothetical protein
VIAGLMAAKRRAVSGHDRESPEVNTSFLFQDQGLNLVVADGRRRLDSVDRCDVAIGRRPSRAAVSPVD